MIQAILECINQQIEDNLYRGASVALFHNGQWEEHYIGSIDGKNPVHEGLVYDLASVSKVVGVGTLIIFWLNSGALKLDEPLVTYYPDFHDGTVTLRQLLTHTSGIDPYIPNRNEMDAYQLKMAINQIRVTDDKSFKYTDINFLLLGFMLERLSGKNLDALLTEEIFKPLGLIETTFGPVPNAVPTIRGVTDGLVHDPKAKVLGQHAGSAGLFSTLRDLERFSMHYLEDDFAQYLWQNYSQGEKTRSIAWNLEGNWIEHTGYTGPFIMINLKEQKAAIFLTNRTYDYDDRPLWIAKRQELRQIIAKSL